MQFAGLSNKIIDIKYHYPIKKVPFAINMMVKKITVTGSQLLVILEKSLYMLEAIICGTRLKLK